MKTGEFAAVCPVGAIKKAGLINASPCGPSIPSPVGSFGAVAGPGAGVRKDGRIVRRG